jgi:ABC-2 type transport system permease protein
MNVRRLRAIARKEFIHVFRDPRALAVSIALPLILLLLFGYALTLDLDRVPLAVWDQSRTVESRELAARFAHSRYFSVVQTPENYREIEAAMDRNQLMMALVIPVEFGRKVASDRPTQVQVLVDGSDANTATLEAPAPALDLRPRMWFNTDMESRIYIVPGLIAVIIMLIAALLTSLTVAREWETGTMEQLIATPVRGEELMLGKLAPYFAIGALDTLLAMLAGYFLFGVPMRGNLLLLFSVSGLYILGALSLGILISAKAKTQLLASQLAFTTTFLPAFLLSGFMFDIGNMPRILQLVTYLVPARYFVAILRGLYLKGTGLAELWPECLLLLVFAVAMLGLSIRSFKKHLV